MNKKLETLDPFEEGSLYHIYNRVNGGARLFLRDENYRYFLDRYSFYLRDVVDTFSYCLLPNHFHILIRIKQGIANETVVAAFRKFFISYSLSLNKESDRKGSLFQRQFRRKRISDERYFLNAVYYINTNPLHHGMTDDISSYRFSSYHEILFSSDMHICTSEMVEWFGGVEAFKRYHEERKRTIFDGMLMIEDE